jgi:hypothetical protein
MIRNRKTLEEQLAEARVKKEQVAARLDQLEARRKARDARMRAWGEKVLVGVMLNAATSRVELKTMLEGLVANAELNPKQRDAALWVLGSLEVPVAPEFNAAAAAASGGGVPSHSS